MDSYTKKLLTISFALYGVWALQTQGADTSQGQNQTLQTSDQPLDSIETVDSDSLIPAEIEADSSSENVTSTDHNQMDTILNEYNETKDHTLGDTNLNDKVKAAELGITPETFKSFQGLLETAGIDLSPEEKLSNNISGGGQIDSQTKREERSLGEFCPESPDGVDPCIPCHTDPKTTFWHTDNNGYQCECPLCKITTYMEIPCTCKRDGDVKDEPTCDFPEPGKFFMPYRNWCHKPFKCKTTCPGDLIIVKNCTVSADTECGCPKHTDQTGPSTCQPIPRCNEGFESRLEGSTSIYSLLYPMRYSNSLHICKPCQEGFVQPNNNTWDNCHLAPHPTASDDQAVHISLESEEDTINTIAGSTASSSDETIPETPAINLSLDNTNNFTNCSCSCAENPPVQSDTKFGTSIRLLNPIILAITWISTLIIAYILGHFGIITILRKFCQWCKSVKEESQDSRSSRASSNGCNRNKEHVVDMEPMSQGTSSHQSMVRFCPKTDQTRTEIEENGRSRQRSRSRSKKKSKKSK